MHSAIFYYMKMISLFIISVALLRMLFIRPMLLEFVKCKALARIRPIPSRLSLSFYTPHTHIHSALLIAFIVKLFHLNNE